MNTTPHATSIGQKPHSAWPAALRMALVALIAAVGFILAGPATDASAAPPPPDPAASSPESQPSWRSKLSWNMYGSWVHEELDPRDRYYQVKLPVQILAQRIEKRTAAGGTTFNVKDDVPAAVEDFFTWNRKSRETPKVLAKQLTNIEKKIERTKNQRDKTASPNKQAKERQKLETLYRQHRHVSGKLRDPDDTKPAPTGKEITQLDTQVRTLKKKLGDLERKASKQQTMTRAGRDRVQQKIDGTRAALSRAQDERDRLRRQDDDGDTGGTRPAPTGPKTPPKGPSTSSVEAPKGPVVSSVKSPKSGPNTPRGDRARGTGLAESEADRRRLQGPPDDGDTGGTRATPRDPKQPPRGPGSTNPTTTSTTSQGNKSATITRPTAMSKTGFRGTGANQMADAVAGVIADGISQDYAASLDSRNQQLLEQARKDPALAKRIIDDYNEIKDNNEIEVLFRAFDTSKGFTQGATRAVAPELIKSQKALDTAKAIADKSNADPFVKKARTTCGGYTPCVRERADRLRKQNEKAIADSTDKAKKSNADPLYQKAHTECGGYDTCVTERTRKLREQSALYLQAQKECGGYDTCVTERTRKLREQADEAAAKKPRTAEDTKPGTKQKHTGATKAKQPHKARSAPQSTSSTHNVAQPKKKKTQTPDYHGKGGVVASAF
ncbi:hypothetical protein ACFYPN_32535 [Streptomyces sp. NPDC005576]|uniref:hypothetical protein n=1 Tax=Streptomyces sp. NPDC005576 TaxID=3364726 RepID=UPI003679FE15